MRRSKLPRASMMLVGLVAFQSTCALAAPALPEDFTVEGRLYSSTGVPLATSVDFKLELYDEANPTCVLYRETRSDVDLTSSDASAQGTFSLRLGAVAPDFGAAPMASLFAPGAITGDGCTVTAINGSHRLVRVSVRKHGDSTFEALSPDTRITSVPLAKVSENALALQGVGTSALAILNPATNLVQSSLEYLFSTANYPKLKALVDGNSSSYLPASPTTAVDFNRQRLVDLADPTAAQDATTKAYADRTIAGRAVDVSTVGPMVGDGNVLKWDATANKWVAVAENRAPLGAAGGDLTATYPNPAIAAGAVTSAKIADAAITTTKLTSSAAGPNRLLITDATTGSTVTLGSCPVNEVYVWTALGWSCSTIAALSPVTSVAGRTGAVTLTAADVANLGTAALYDFGTSPNQIVRLDANSSLPAVDGSHLANVNSTRLQGLPVSGVAPGLGQVLTWNGTAWMPAVNGLGTVTLVSAGPGLNGGSITSAGTLAVDVGTGASKILQLNANAQIPAVDGSLLSNVNATKLQTQNVSPTVPGAGQVLAYDLPGKTWVPSTPNAGTVTSVTGAAGLLGGTITSTGTLAIDVGTTANKIVQLNSAARLPALDASLLTNVNASKLAAQPVSTALPSDAQVLTWNAAATQWSPATAKMGTVTTVVASTGLTGGTITAAGTLAVDVGSTAGKILQLDSSARLPVVDGSLVTNVDATKLQSKPVATTAPSSGQVLTYNATSGSWFPTTPASGTVTNVTAGPGLLGGTISGAGTISADSGTSANKLVQLNAAAQLPAVDGSLLTALNASNLTSGTVAAARLPTLTPAMFANQPGNVVLATANGSAGPLSFRALTTADLPAGALTGTAPSGYIPKYDTAATLNASPLFVSGTSIGVNKTSPSATLDVVGSIAASGGITSSGFLMSTYNTTTLPNYDSGAFAASWNRSSGFAEVNLYNTYRDPQIAFQFSKKSATTPFYKDLMTIKGDGTVGIGTTNPIYALDVYGVVRAINYTDYSDRRLKKRIRDLDGSLAKISQLRGVSYVWRDPKQSPRVQLGFVAQEVEEVFPELVHTDTRGIKSLDYSHLVSPLVEAVKTLRQENEELRARLERLERRLDP